MKSEIYLTGNIKDDITKPAHGFNAQFRDEVIKNLKTDGYRATIVFDFSSRLSPSAQSHIVRLKRKANTFSKTIIQGRLFIGDEAFKSKESIDRLRMLLATVSCMIDVGAVVYTGKIENIRMAFDETNAFANGWKVFVPDVKTRSYENSGVKTSPAKDALVSNDIDQPDGRIVRAIDKKYPYPTEPNQRFRKFMLWWKLIKTQVIFSW